MMPTLNRRLSRESYMGRSCVCEKALQPYATNLRGDVEGGGEQAN